MESKLSRVGVIALLLVAGAARAESREDAARRCAEQMQAALLKADLASFAKYLHPRVLELVGGKAKMMATLKRSLQEMKRQGMGFHAVEVDRPAQIVRAGKELHAVLGMRVIMKRPEGLIRVRSYLIGVSSDEGRSWLFLDGAKLGPANVRKVLPNFSSELRLPKPLPPEPVEAR